MFQFTETRLRLFLEGETVKTYLFRKVINILFPKVSDDITSSIDKINIETIRTISIIIALYEIACYPFVLAGFIKVDSLKETTVSVSFIVLLSLLLFFYSKRVKARGYVSHIKTLIIIAVVFILLSAYSMELCYAHYRVGKDIFTFFIVMVIFAAFIIIKPYLSVSFLFLSFLIFYLLLYSYDGAKSFHVFNYFAFAGICCVGSATKYNLMLRQQQGQQEVIYLNTALEKSARYDALTKLKNRYALTEDSKNYYNKSLHITMCDCDDFKNINDRYGHIVGDRVLSAVAQLFRETFKDDFIYRYGGDEFLIISADNGSDDFEALTDKINAQLDNIRVEGADEKISCSFGGVSGTAENEAEFEALIQTADKNMYLEKQRKNH